MARTKVYKQKAITSTISADVKMTVKLGDNYFSISGHEERTVPNEPDVELDREWEFLWDNVYEECDKEMEKVLQEFDNKKSKKTRK